jgi:hypothetical protein
MDFNKPGSASDGIVKPCGEAIHCEIIRVDGRRRSGRRGEGGSFDRRDERGDFSRGRIRASGGQSNLVLERAAGRSRTKSRSTLALIPINPCGKSACGRKRSAGTVATIASLSAPHVPQFGDGIGLSF